MSSQGVHKYFASNELVTKGDQLKKEVKLNE